MTLTICYTLLYVLGQTAIVNSVDPDETPLNAASHQGLHYLLLIQLFSDTTLGSKLHFFKFQIKYAKELRYLTTKDKYVKKKKQTQKSNDRLLANLE